MLKADVIVGALFGDEGKGKLVGAVAHSYDAVFRVNASTNAGHCVNDGINTYVTRQLPSVFHPESTLLVIGPGALLNLSALLGEVQSRPDLALIHGKVKVASSIALVIKPYVEKGQSGMSRLLGSTHQGTGPSAVARAARHALRLYDIQAAARGDLGAVERAETKLLRTCVETSPLRFSNDAAEDKLYCSRLLAELLNAYRRVELLLGAFCVDYTKLLAELDASSQRILVEGCNGLLLDNFHGALPHVTSMPTNVGAMICGANISPKCVKHVIVVAAAYATCLGMRPFPTELSVEEAAHFFEACNEVDVAQQNPRRIGWLDVPALRKALVGCQGAVIHLNKLDVLSGLPRIKVCTHYRIDGDRYDVLPDDPELAAKALAEYVEVDGWQESIREARLFADLPAAARAYVQRLQELLPNEIVSLGVGPANQDLISDPW